MKLLGTFSTIESLDQTIKSIQLACNYNTVKIYVYALENSDELLLSYSVKTSIKILPNTLFIHRKSKTNTLYTINGLNMLQYKLCGRADIILDLDWSLYQNMLIHITNNSLQMRNIILKETKLLDIYNK